MNGFLIALGGHDRPYVGAPHLSDEMYQHQQLDGAHILSWGRGGDVHHVHSDRSIVILSGYVAEASFLPSGRSPEMTCRALLEQIDRSTRVGEALSRVAEQIHGSFAIVVVRPKDGVVYTVTDRISSRAVWCKRTTGGIVASSNAVALAQATGENAYDPGGLGSFLLYGGQLDPSRCVYEGVHADSSGTVTTRRMDGTTETHTWYRYRHRPQKRSRRAWLDLTADRLKSAARRILDISPRPLIFLSGGVDSRLATAAICAAGGQPVLATLADVENMETRIARWAARAFGCSHELILRDPLWYLRNMMRAVFDTSGAYLFHQAHFAVAYETLRQSHHTDAAVLGDFCEAFSKLLSPGQKQTTTIRSERDFQALLHDVTLVPPYRAVDRQATLSLLRADVRHEAEAGMRRDIAARYAEAMQVSTDARIVADYFVRWQSARCIGTFGMLLDVRSAGPERSLMFDKDLHELLEIMPADIRDGANLGKSLIRRLHLAAGLVVDANSYLPLSFPPAAHALATAARPLLGRLRRRFVEDSHLTTASWSHLPMLYGHNDAWQARINDLLTDSSLLSPDVFDHVEIERCWAELRAGNLRRSADLESLIHLACLAQLRA